MEWADVLKRKDWMRDDERKPFGITDQTGGFTIDMFDKNDWRKSLGSLLSLTVTDSEKGELSRGMDKVVEEAMNAGVDYYFAILETLLNETDFADRIEEAYSESESEPKLGHGEHEVSEPKSGQKGSGMMPKEVERITNSISEGIETSIETIMRAIHERLDSDIAEGEEEEELDLEQIDFSKGIPKEFKEQIWNEAFPDAFKEKIIGETLDKVLDNVGLMDSPEYRNSVIQVMKDNPITKEFFTHLYVILGIKITEGMSYMNPDKLQRNLGDVLTPQEKAWMEKHSKELSIDTPMGRIDAGKAYPELDESTGIPKVEQRDPETGEKYYIPEHGDEEDAEWRQWADANRSENSPNNDWFDVLKG